MAANGSRRSTDGPYAQKLAAILRNASAPGTEVDVRGLAPGKAPLEVEMNLERVVPDQYKRHAHHWLILHGRYVCVARRPLCEKCIIADLCKWPGKATLDAPA